MKKVIVFSAELLPYSETFIGEQVRAMRHWHPVLVGERLVPKGLSLDGIDVQLLYPTEHRRIHRCGFRLCRLIRQPYPPTLRKLRQIDAQLMHVHFGTNAADIWPHVRALGLPMLVTLHGYDINIHREWWEAGNGGRRRRRYPYRLLRLADEPKVKFIAVSKAIRARAIEYGIPADKITVHYIGVDTERFRPDGLSITQRSKRVLFVGRLVEKKGAEYLIRAFSQLRNRVPGVELVVAGDGPQRAELEYLAASLHLPVAFLGVLPPDQIKQQMDLAKLFCLPSLTAANGDAEGFGMVLLEAQASGLPVISSARGGSYEGIIDGETGFRTREKDVDDLVDHLARLLLDDHLLSRLSENAIEFVKQQFDLPTCTNLLEQTYDAIA